MNTQPERFCAVIPAPFGAIGIRIKELLIHELVYLPSSHRLKPASSALTQECEHQLNAYFQCAEVHFNLPLMDQGTLHQRKVWDAITAIPLGQVQTYGQIARSIGSSPRAVGQACGANWFPLIIPCHRVTAASGLGGFAHHSDEYGFHLSVKRWLLAHEGVHGF